MFLAREARILPFEIAVRRIHVRSRSSPLLGLLNGFRFILIGIHLVRGRRC